MANARPYNAPAPPRSNAATSKRHRYPRRAAGRVTSDLEQQQVRHRRPNPDSGPRGRDFAQLIAAIVRWFDIMSGYRTERYAHVLGAGTSTGRSIGIAERSMLDARCFMSGIRTIRTMRLVSMMNLRYS
jgi:hypothetical protein